jgi:hypothetical protein
MLFPVMHQINIFTHYYFVPFRLLWDNPTNRDDSWEAFATGGVNGLLEPVFPTFRIPSLNGGNLDPLMSPGQLADYLGFPIPDQFRTQPSGANTDQFSRLPFLAYQMIYNEYYRDETLQPYGTTGNDPIDFRRAVSGFYPTNGGLMTNITMRNQLMRLRYRNWEKDYFTTSLPFAQRGKEVTLSFGSQLTFSGSTRLPVEINNDSVHTVYAGGNLLYGETYLNDDTWRGLTLSPVRPGEPDIQLSVPLGNTALNVNENTSLSINQLRESIVLQQFYERMARGGSRYTEYLQSIFGTSPSDSRLQRPEYLGGTKEPLVISEVLQTSEKGSTPQGNMSGHALCYGRGSKISREFTEPGYIIGLMSIMPRPSYQQGMPRHYLKRDRFEFLIPQFAHLGEQEVKNAELFFGYSQDGSPVRDENNNTFGYQERYAEYRFIPSTVHGDFRDSMSDWHLSRIFANRPTLSGQFTRLQPLDQGMLRIFAVEDGTDPFWAQLLLKITARRPLPVYGEPGLPKI